MRQPLNPQDRYQPPMVAYNFLTYMPAVMGIFFANLLNLSPVVSLYVARILLAVASVLIVYVAIRLLPSRKYLFVVLGLLPMMLFQQAMVGTDGISYALLILFISYLYHLYKQTDPITWRQWVGLLAVCSSLVWAKPLLYLFIPLAMLLIKKKNAWRWLAGVTIVSIVMFAANSFMATNAGRYSTTDRPPGAPENVLPQEQLQNLVKNPKRGLRVLWNSYMTSYGDDEVRGIVGTFGAADTFYPLWMSYLYIVSLGVAALFILNGGREKDLIPKTWRLLGLGLALVHFIAVNLAIYLSYTPYDFDIIYGVQGRYFIPTLLIVMGSLCIGRGVELKKIDRLKVASFISVVVSVVVLLSLFITYQRYFLYTP